MKMRFFDLAIIAITVPTLLLNSSAYAIEDDKFSYFSVELVQQEWDAGSTTETAKGYSTRYSNSLTRRLHIRGELLSLDYDDIDKQEKSLELGLGFVLLNAPSSKVYLAALASRDRVSTTIGLLTTTEYSNSIIGLAGMRIRSDNGVEGIFELKHVQPEDDTRENGQIIEIGVKIFPPENDKISLGIMASAFESGETVGNTQQFSIFLEMGF